MRCHCLKKDIRETKEGSRDTDEGRVSEGFLEERHGCWEMNQVKVDNGADDGQWNATGR